jgi:hypothetical protein
MGIDLNLFRKKVLPKKDVIIFEIDSQKYENILK